MSCHISSYHISHHIIYHIISYHIISHHITFHIISYIVSYHINITFHYALSHCRWMPLHHWVCNAYCPSNTTKDFISCVNTQCHLVWVSNHQVWQLGQWISDGQQQCAETILPWSRSIAHSHMGPPLTAKLCSHRKMHWLWSGFPGAMCDFVSFFVIRLSILMNVYWEMIIVALKCEESITLKLMC